MNMREEDVEECLRRAGDGGRGTSRSAQSVRERAQRRRAQRRTAGVAVAGSAVALLVVGGAWGLGLSGRDVVTVPPALAPSESSEPSEPSEPSSAQNTSAPSPTVDTPNREIGMIIQGEGSREFGQLALAAGTLIVADANCLAIAIGDSRRIGIAWPYGWDARRVGETAVVYDAQGRVFASEGDHIELGGGYTSTFLNHPCAFDGRPWLANADIGRDSSPTSQEPSTETPSSARTTMQPAPTEQSFAPNPEPTSRPPSATASIPSDQPPVSLEEFAFDEEARWLEHARNYPEFGSAEITTGPAPWAAGNCGEGFWVIPQDVVDMRTVRSPGPHLSEERQVAVFASEREATAAFEGLRAGVRACQAQIDPETYGDEGFRLARRTTAGDVAAGDDAFWYALFNLVIEDSDVASAGDEYYGGVVVLIRDGNLVTVFDSGTLDAEHRRKKIPELTAEAVNVIERLRGQ